MNLAEDILSATLNFLDFALVPCVSRSSERTQSERKRVLGFKAHFPFIWVDPFVERPVNLRGEDLQLNLRAEAFNVFNHANFFGFNGVYGNLLTPSPHPRNTAAGHHESASGTGNAVFSRTGLQI